MKREKFSDAQSLRTDFYSCHDDSSKSFFYPDTDSRHKEWAVGEDFVSGLISPVRKKICVIRKSLRKVSGYQARVKRKRIKD